jgi:hypothetical protein
MVLLFSLKGLSKEEIGFFEGTGKTMKHIKVFSLEEMDEDKIVKLIKLVKEKYLLAENYKY